MGSHSTGHVKESEIYLDKKVYTTAAEHFAEVRITLWVFIPNFHILACFDLHPERPPGLSPVGCIDASG